MTHCVHHHGQRSQRSAVVKTQHLDALIVRTLRIQPHDGTTIDHLTSVDVEPDPILAERSADFLREVLSRPDPPLQLVMVGATFGPRARQLADAFMGDSPV